MSDGKDISLLVNTIQHREFQEVLRKTLPSAVTQERFTQATVAALRHQPEVFVECDRNSIYNAIVQAAKDGLLPDGRHGVLVPFNTKRGDKWVKLCQFLIMVEGIIDKLAKIGITCYATSVYAGEKIRIWNDDTGQHIEHEPTTFGARGERIGAYACARIQATGVTYVEAMNMEDLEVARRATKAKDKNGKLIGPWAEVPDRMEQKTCLHRLCKRLPNVELPEDEEFREPPKTITVAPVEAVSPAPKPDNGRPSALQRVVDSQRKPTKSMEAEPADEEPPPISEPF